MTADGGAAAALLPGATASSSAPAAADPAATQAAGPVAKMLDRARPLPWLWMAVGGLLLALGGTLAALGGRRRKAPPEIVVPLIERSDKSLETLAVSVEAMRLDRSILNATVGYRVTVRNRTAAALSGVVVEADLVSASRDRAIEQQIAFPEQALTERHRAERLAPGQSLRFEGQVRLPLSEASAIWQGRIGLLVPLLRVRATAAQARPVATTLVIGRSEGNAARPQPFRLDEPPRSYAPLAQRVLDGVAARA